MTYIDTLSEIVKGNISYPETSKTGYAGNCRPRLCGYAVVTGLKRWN